MNICVLVVAYMDDEIDECLDNTAYDFMVQHMIYFWYFCIII